MFEGTEVTLLQEMADESLFFPLDGLPLYRRHDLLERFVPDELLHVIVSGGFTDYLLGVLGGFEQLDFHARDE